jgi:hypothetical protein
MHYGNQAYPKVAVGTCFETSFLYIPLLHRLHNTLVTAVPKQQLEYNE